ncbi:nucleolar protein 9 [Mobula hypostoma]|uniref:nucleolar protein 9 n=1 Tax=Mobula hypostoma TaxID=723540 RepID=UPI002FC29F1D
MTASGAWKQQRSNMAERSAASGRSDRDNFGYGRQLMPRVMYGFPDKEEKGAAFPRWAFPTLSTPVLPSQDGRWSGMAHALPVSSYRDGRSREERIAAALNKMAAAGAKHRRRPYQYDRRTRQRQRRNRRGSGSISGGGPIGELGSVVEENDTPHHSVRGVLVYCQQLMPTLMNGFPDKEEKRLFLSNVLTEIKGREVRVCTNPDGSIFLVRLVDQCDVPALRRFLAALQPHLWLVASHRCGARVMQAALLQVTQLASNLQEQGEEEEEEEEDDDDAEGEEEEGGEGRTLEGQVRQLSSCVRSDLLKYVRDAQGNLFVRDLLQVLGGVVPCASKLRRSTHKDTPKGFDLDRGLDLRAGQVKEFSVPEGFLDELRDYAQLLADNMTEFLTNPTASAVLQVAARVLGRRLPDVAQELCSAILKSLGEPSQDGQNSSLLEFMKDRTGSRLLEAVVLVMDAKLFTEFYTSNLKGRLEELALHPMANFAVQRALAVAPTSLFSEICGELLPSVEDVLAEGHLGVVVEMVSGCVRHSSGQAEMMNHLLEAFHCDKPVSRKRSCFLLLVSLQTYQVFFQLPEQDSKSEYEPSGVARLKLVNYHGTLLAQHLLNFEKPITLVRSMAESPVDDLLVLACNPAGSHVFDSLIDSTTVSEKQKKAVLRKFTGHFFQLACSKHGSRVFDQIWLFAPLEMRRSIAQELSEKRELLKASRYGHRAIRKMDLGTFRRKLEDWESLQESETRKRKAVSDILETEAGMPETP